MNTRVFKISGKFQQYGIWSDREADFIGWFVKKDGTDVIEGYLEEQYYTPYDKVRYIKGLYDESKKQLAFIKLCNSLRLQPLAYAFPDLDEQGFWGGYDFFDGFFPSGKYEGQATVQLEEIHDENQRQKLAQKVMATFEEKSGEAHKLNYALLELAEQLLVEFLNENFKWQ